MTVRATIATTNQAQEQTRALRDELTVWLTRIYPSRENK
jgi:hypothetical protein